MGETTAEKKTATEQKDYENKNYEDFLAHDTSLSFHTA